MDLTTTSDIDAQLAPGEVVLWRGKPERQAVRLSDLASEHIRCGAGADGRLL